MYVIAVYDVASERTGKMLKLCRRYLHWIQNSVFEGELSEVGYRELKLAAEAILIPEEGDSFIVFKNRHRHWLEKEVIGCERMPTDQFL
ncbi:MAG: CRISPR-associated endonuclease Cas2 [Bacteroidota bacterium]